MTTKASTLAKRRTTQEQSAPLLDGRTLSARRDTLDFRDKMYVPTLIEVPTTRSLDNFLKHQPVILDQGQEGACTGFGLAAVANHLVKTRRNSPPYHLLVNECSMKWQSETTNGPEKSTKVPAPAAR